MEDLRPSMNSDISWHRLPGIHAVLRARFRQHTSLDCCKDVVISNEVGLAKTYQAACVMAFLADAADRQKEAVPMPLPTA